MSQVDRSVEAARSFLAMNDFDDFYEAHHHRLATSAYLLTGSRNDAEDIAQEALARAYERWDRVRRMDSPVGYVYRIALNLSRKRWRRISREREDVHMPETGEDEAEAIVRRVAIRAAMRSLSLKQREALVLTEWLELSSAEAGSLLGVSAESVRARARRAREVLQRNMAGLDE